MKENVREYISLNIQSCYFFLLFIFERETDRQSINREGAKRERETENLKQAPGSKLSVSTESDTGLEPRNNDIMT